MSARLTRLGSALAVAGAAHTVVNARLLRRPTGSAAVFGPVSVLVPARDEAAMIEACIRSLIGQPGVAEVIVLDDRSRDDTAGLAARAGARVVAGAALPAGWLGKPWACAQLVDVAAPASEVLVFVDADVRLSATAVTAALGVLGSNGLDIACPFPRQEAVGPAERLVQPLLQWSWLTMLPLRLAERSPRPSLTAACGQFVLVRRAALERAGGFAAVRGEVLDDLALVRAVKATGGRGGVVDGTALATTRMYGGWPELRDGYGKSLWSAFGSATGAAAVTGGLALAYILPAAAALRGSRVGLVGYAAGVASRVLAARATGGQVLPDALVHPASITVFGYLTMRSVALRRSGVLRWKGRAV